MDHRGFVMLSVDDLAKFMLPKGAKILDMEFIRSRRAQLRLTVEHEDLPDEGPSPQLSVQYTRKPTVKGWEVIE